MKHFIRIITLSILVLASCKKEETPATTQATPKPDTTTFTVVGDMFTTDYIFFFADKPIGKTTPFVWDFGDGTTSSEEDSLIHLFNNDGTYTIKLTVDGITSSKTITTTSNWKKIMDTRTWNRLYFRMLSNNVRDTIRNSDTSFALQQIDINKIILPAENGTIMNDTIIVSRLYVGADNSKPYIEYKSPVGGYPTNAQLNWYKQNNSISFSRMKHDATYNITYVVGYTSK